MEDHAAAILEIVLRGKQGEIYNIGTGLRISNKELLILIARALNADTNLVNPVKDRLGHDFRYALNSEKIKSELGWKHRHILEDAIQECNKW